MHKNLMWMEVHLHSVNAKSQAGSSRYNDNTKRPKWKENQLGILKIYAFCWKIQQRTPGPGEHLPHKSCCNFTYWFMEVCSWSIVVTWLRLVSRLYANTSSPDIYWRKRPNWQAHLELCHRNPDVLERVLNWIALSSSTAGSAHPCKL